MRTPDPASIDVGGVRIQIASDLHIDAWQRSGFSVPFVPDSDADALILAGDQCNGLDPGAMRWLLDLADTKFWPMGIFLVLGNHDHYGLRIDAAGEAWAFLETACRRLHVLDNRIVGLPLRSPVGRHLRIAGCTLWSDFRRGNPIEMLAWRTTPDCLAIQANGAGRSATPDDLYAAHQADQSWLQGLEPGSDDSPLLVVTHHAPSWRSADTRYSSNGAFVSDLDDLVLRLNPLAWVHGHTHAIHDYRIGETRVLARPIGYPGETVLEGCVERMDGACVASGLVPCRMTSHTTEEGERT